MSFKVNASMCKTCIFGSHSPIPPERFEQLKSEWVAKDCVQICHTAPGIGCRGHYEAARSGEIPHPLTNIMDHVYGLSGLKTADLMQVTERLRHVVFIPLPSKE